MTLYVFIVNEKADFDTYDDIYDICVTVCEPYEYAKGEKKDYYDIFSDLIMKSVSVIRKTGECTCLCAWSRFIILNKDTFIKAANDLWVHVPEDENQLVYEWIREINYWLAGYVSENIYKRFVTDYGNLLKAA